MATPPTPAPGHTGFSVSVADVASTAASFGRIHTTASAAGVRAAAGLSGSAGMVGVDEPTAAWRGRYDAVAGAAWAACGAAVGTLHDVAAKLVETGDAYLAADHASTPGATGAPGTLPALPAAVPIPAGPPSATGPSGGTAPPGLAEYRPGGDPARLRAAGAAWSALAEGLDDAALDADKAFRALTAHNTGPGFSAMTAFWSSRYALCAGDPLFNVAPIGARTLGQVCAAMADLIEHTRTTFDRAAEDAAREFEPLETFAPPELLARIPIAPTRAVALFEVLGEPLLHRGFVELGRSQYLAQLDELTRQLSTGLEDRLKSAARFPEPVDTQGRQDAAESMDTPGVTVADLGQVTGLGLNKSGWDGVASPHPTPDSVHIVPERVVHVLDGDGPTKPGGGHRAGLGKSGKTEFPTWPDEKVIAEVLSVARDPGSNPPPLLQQNGRYKLIGVRDGVTIAVIVRPDGWIVTAHPLSGPGVRINP